MYRCRHGQICFQLKKPIEAAALPWNQFDQLPFIVMTFENKLGNTNEYKVDMNKIRRAIEFMTRKKNCPVTGKQRNYYRLSQDIPFTSENMQLLSQSVQDPSRPSLPKNLRTLDSGILHDRADKAIQMPELQSWLSS